MTIIKVLGVLALGGLAAIVGSSAARVQETGASGKALLNKTLLDKTLLAPVSQSRTQAKAMRDTKVASRQAPAPAAAQPAAAAAPAWSSRCASASRQSVPECAIEQTAVLDKTGQMLASVSVRLPPAGGQPVMMVHVPVGLFLPAGISLRIDEQAPLQLVVQTCDLRGCYAGSPVSAEMLKAMKAGKRLAVGFQSLSKQAVTVPLTLAQFAESYQRIQ